MEVRTLADALRMIMRERGWSQTDLARELGVSQVWVSNVTRGQRDPGLARSAGYLARVGWEIRLCPARVEEDPVKRREFMAATASVAFVPAQKVGPFQDPEYVRMLASRLDLMRDEQGGVPLVSTAMRHVNHLRQAINSRDRNLQAAASDLARKAALVLDDARELDPADQAGALALTLARRADYVEGAAHSYENLCLFSSRRGDAGRAATYAGRGLQLPELPDEHRARLNVRLAAALSRQKGYGFQRQTRAAMDEALGIDGIPPAATAVVAGNVGIAQGRLGLYEDAQKSLTEAVRIFRRTPLMYAAYLASQTKAALQAADPSMAADLMFRLARATPLVTSARVDKHVSDIMAASAQWAKVPEMRDARAQLSAVTAVSVRPRDRGTSG